MSLNRFTKWLGSKVEEAGITIFTGFAGSELLIEDDAVTAVRTDDKGIDKTGERKANFEPGYDLRAKVTILAEGPRGSLTKQLIGRFQLDRDRNPQTYGVGVKELWELPPGRFAPGQVIYTMGWPLTTKEYGGAWIYDVISNEELDLLLLEFRQLLLEAFRLHRRRRGLDVTLELLDARPMQADNCTARMEHAGNRLAYAAGRPGPDAVAQGCGLHHTRCSGRPR